MIKAIIFDFYDVIHGDPYNRWLKSHGYKRQGPFAEASDLLDVGKINTDEFVLRLSKLSKESTDTIMEEFNLVSKVDEEVVRLIDQLHQKYKIALLSNAPSESLRLKIKDYDLEKHFDEIIISSEVGLIKPSREIFELIIKKLNIDHSEAIFIDDSKHHIEGAEKVGIKSIQFTSIRQLIDDLNKIGVTI